MSFWQDASPVIKAVIVIGGLLIVAALGVQCMAPGGSPDSVQQTRGIPAP
jgi:hypothetical protein